MVHCQSMVLSLVHYVQPAVILHSVLRFPPCNFPSYSFQIFAMNLLSSTAVGTRDATRCDTGELERENDGEN